MGRGKELQEEQQPGELRLHADPKGHQGKGPADRKILEEENAGVRGLAA